ncbi:MAG: ExbD/TolR family protein [Phycisphaerales bacterium]
MRPMRRRNALAVHELHYGPNMTPMVDVVMVILVFFMASAAVLGPEWFLGTSIPVKASADASAPPPEHKPVRVELRLVDGGVVVMIGARERVAFNAAEALLMDEIAVSGGREAIVLVAPGPDVPYDVVVRVHEWIARAGVTKLGIDDGVGEKPESPTDAPALEPGVSPPTPAP